MNHEKALGGRFELPSYESTGFPDLRLTRLGYPSLTWADCVLIYNFLTFMHNKSHMFCGYDNADIKDLEKDNHYAGGEIRTPELREQQISNLPPYQAGLPRHVR
jgi:hypothetical protein